MKLKMQLAAVALLAGVAACGAQANAATSSVHMPSCATWTAKSGATDVLELHQSSFGATFTGTVSAGGLNARLTGSTEAGDKFTGKAVVASGITIPVHGVYTSTTVKFHGPDGTDTYTSSRSCPS